MSKIRKLKVERILTELENVLQSATMKNACFGSCCSVGELPQKVIELSDFIKQITKLWRDSCLVEPLERIIKELENEMKR